MSDVDRISDADVALLARLNKACEAGRILQSFVSDHLKEVYDLKDGDRVEDDGTIHRLSSDDEPTPLRAVEA